jgi:hypothetical protein
MKEQYISLDYNETQSEKNINYSLDEKGLNSIFLNEKEDFFHLNDSYPNQNYDDFISNTSNGDIKKLMIIPSLEQNKSDITSICPSDLIYYIKNESKSDFNYIKGIDQNESPSSDYKIDNSSKSINFKTVLYQKRGRKVIEKPKNNIVHGPNDFDNILRKIQVSFITFLIKLANDAIKSVLGKKCKYFFKDIEYEFKSKINHNSVTYLKQCKYSDIIQQKISTKNRKYGENLNKETFLKLSEISTELKSFFDKNYLYIFQKYYYNIKDNQNILDFDGLTIKLSPQTKGFGDLLRKENNKDKFNNVCQLVFFSDINYLNDTNEKIISNSNQFIVSTIDIKEE